MTRHVGQVLAAFGKLGLTSFGGPVAHLGFFRDEFVTKKKWMSDASYADLVALAQFLPGPASSQVSMAIGLQRAGVLGLLAAWAAFTLPSAIALVAFAYGAGVLGAGGWLTGLKAAAVAVVAHALVGMAKSLTPDLRRALISATAFLIATFLPGPLAHVAAIIAGGIAGYLFCTASPKPGSVVAVPMKAGIAAAALWLGFLVALPLMARAGSALAAFITMFYRPGSLVFGGGHVVLPLLQAETAGIVGSDQFLAGYGAAQAVPGPLFTLASYLGFVADGPYSGLLGATIALIAIFLPAGLVLIAGLALWSRLSHSASARRAMAGINAGVVGILASALYDPVLTEGVDGWGTAAFAAACFAALWKLPAWAVVIAAAAIGAIAL